jgi:hypothetical protein
LENIIIKDFKSKIFLIYHYIRFQTTDFIYIRFIGDRSIVEKDFGKIQKDKVSEMRK